MHDVNMDNRLPEVEGFSFDKPLANLNGKTQLLRALLIKFIQQFKDSDSQLREFLQNNQIQDAIMLTHTIKGTGSNLGALFLANSAAIIEQELKNNLRPSDTSLALFSEANIALRYLEKLIVIAKSAEPEKQTKLNATEQVKLQQSLRQLLKLLHSDIARVQDIIGSLTFEYTKTVFGSDLTSIQQALIQFELEEVAQRTQDLLRKISAD